MLSNLKITNSEFNQQGENKIMDEVNFDIFDLSEGEQNKDEKVSLFFRETDENEEKKILFDVSEEENSVESDIKESDIKESDYIKEGDIKESDYIKESNIEESNIDESNIEESDIEESDVKESDVKESDIKESDIKESDNDVYDKELHDDDHMDDEPKKSNINTYELNNNTKKKSSIWKGSDGSGTLKVFKLYSKLPMKDRS